MEPSSMLEHYSQRVARYSINLNGKITLDKSMAPNRGGLASVYPGTLRQGVAENKVAIKVYFAPPGDEDILKRVLREIHLWSNLRHENVLRMVGISTDFRDTISIVSDWMAMGYAHSYVQNEENDPRPLLRDIANGLHYLHTHELGPIFHGDLKGMNVLVSNDRRALLTDFGFSTLTKSSFSMDVIPPRGGSFAWMAPELLDDYVTSVAGDVWAFGMTILELFTRLMPFHACKHDANIMLRIIQGRLPDRPMEVSTCFRMTNAWWDICTLCWKQEPSSRPTASELLDKIKQIMGSV
ncbi:hypothetical protein ID866_1488 [Astraeus odoratus]|nr:hypothetical protein ID866_1488 [Astraeus odoratus]